LAELHIGATLMGCVFWDSDECGTSAPCHFFYLPLGYSSCNKSISIGVETGMRAMQPPLLFLAPTSAEDQDILIEQSVTLINHGDNESIQ